MSGGALEVDDGVKGMPAEIESELDREGFVLRRGFLAGGVLELLRQEAWNLQKADGSVCVRDILRRSKVIADFARQHIPNRGLIPVRGILFDKTPEENWPVPWHQDLSIAVAERIETEGYTGWSVKGGVMHVQPPVEVLEKMVTLRVHLDDTPAENGALKVLPKTHRSGRVDARGIAMLTQEEGGGSPTVCEAEEGDALLMKPLILHASARVTGGAGVERKLGVRRQHRRVVHLEFAQADGLAPQLQWFEGQ